MAIIYVDSAVRWSVTIKNASAVLTDPGTLRFTAYRASGASSVSYLYGTDAELVKDATGKYHADYIIPDSAGKWYGIFKSTGSAAGIGFAAIDVSMPAV